MSKYYKFDLVQYLKNSDKILNPNGEWCFNWDPLLNVYISKCGSPQSSDIYVSKLDKNINEEHNQNYKVNFKLYIEITFKNARLNGHKFHHFVKVDYFECGMELDSNIRLVKNLETKEFERYSIDMYVKSQLSFSGFTHTFCDNITDVLDSLQHINKSANFITCQMIYTKVKNNYIPMFDLQLVYNTKSNAFTYVMIMPNGKIKIPNKIDQSVNYFLNDIKYDHKYSPLSFILTNGMSLTFPQVVETFIKTHYKNTKYLVIPYNNLKYFESNTDLEKYIIDFITKKCELIKKPDNTQYYMFLNTSNDYAHIILFSLFKGLFTLTNTLTKQSSFIIDGFTHIPIPDT
jgi:hypothetical protein